MDSQPILEELDWAAAVPFEAVAVLVKVFSEVGVDLTSSRSASWAVSYINRRPRNSNGEAAVPLNASRTHQALQGTVVVRQQLPPRSRSARMVSLVFAYQSPVANAARWFPRRSSRPLRVGPKRTADDRPTAAISHAAKAWSPPSGGVHI